MSSHDEYGSGAASARKIQIDLDSAVNLDIPKTGEALTAMAWETPSGPRGWSVRLPGNRPIATPAYEDGLVFVGGGYGSYEFYAFEAATGGLAWQIRTSDDGPTAAIVEDGLVAFNTESCSIIVCDAKTGRVVWEEWLGDPLMSQPAIFDGKLFIVYPTGQRPPRAQPGSPAPAAAARSRGHALLCADLHAGTHLWEQEVTGDAITAPVVSDGLVYVSCLDGTSFCIKADHGDIVWRERNQATCSPLVVSGRVIQTEKHVRNQEVHEGLRRRRSDTGAFADDRYLTSKPSRYLDEGLGGGSGLSGGFTADLDAEVGFSHAPSSANLLAAAKHIGVSTVSGTWAYQGSRAAFKNGRLFNAQGRYLHCVFDESGKSSWEAEVRSSGIDPGDQLFLPPAVGREYLYYCSRRGHLLSVHHDDGRVGLLYATGRPAAFQPCLAKGSVYFGTIDGELLCVATGDTDADGWYMWGGNAQHNKT